MRRGNGRILVGPRCRFSIRGSSVRSSAPACHRPVGGLRSVGRLERQRDVIVKMQAGQIPHGWGPLNQTAPHALRPFQCTGVGRHCGL